MNPTEKKPVRVRFAPSPTGPLHIGSARTCLFNWLFARQNDGQLILRIEDTDQERSKLEYEKNIIEGLKWLQLDWDGEIYRQSERKHIYKPFIEKLLSEKHAYYCYCTKEELEAQAQSQTIEGLPPKYNGHCRNLTEAPTGRESQVIRLKTPTTSVEFNDLIRGQVKFDSDLIGDFVIAKNEETALYNLAVVIDDAEMKISHVIRGEDHISNTPKQILLNQALGFENPIFVHLPLILNPDRSKLSKRYNETSLLSYRESGYLKETIINFIALLGWHPEGVEEVLTIADLLKLFSLPRVQKAGAIFNLEKLLWLNFQHLKKISDEEIFSRLTEISGEKIRQDHELVLKAISAERERMKTLKDFFELSDFFFVLPDYQKNILIWKDEKEESTLLVLEKLKNILAETSKDNFTKKIIEEKILSLAATLGRGQVFWPFRVALSGKKASPDPLVIAEVIGQNETLKRIETAIQKLKSDE
ncbi:MAG: glutamate--tRNA ligase [Candidatus Paceibacterota bacterium]|jgi:glutamyl-tRNA synthetase